MNNEKHDNAVFDNKYLQCITCIHREIALKVKESFTTVEQLPTRAKVICIIQSVSCSKCKPSYYLEVK